jgi:hypothetical protein
VPYPPGSVSGCACWFSCVMVPPAVRWMDGALDLG